VDGNHSLWLFAPVVHAVCLIVLLPLSSLAVAIVAAWRRLRHVWGRGSSRRNADPNVDLHGWYNASRARWKFERPREASPNA